ncbi:MAG: hypothetical protein JEZ09_14630 [Salinivirgaceae bacterium]|nr:hypothetical protein [Salinivirgaceae bacterium]
MDNIKEFNTASKNSKSYKIIIAVLALILIALGVLYFDQNRKTEQKIAELNEVNKEKETLTFQYQNLLDDFESLETSNDSISEKLEKEQTRIKEIMLELRTVKTQNKSEITKYKKELTTLRDIMKGFIQQIDSLNTANIQLTEENKEIKQQYYSAKKENKQLSDKYEEAADKVELASVIRAIDVNLISFNHKGKNTIKAKKVKRLAVSFSLDENMIAPQGLKNIYIRITDPKDHVLMTPTQEMFIYDSEEIAYSAYREIEYKGSIVNTTVYYDIADDVDLETGIYKADIFCDGNMIGTSTLEIK